MNLKFGLKLPSRIVKLGVNFTKSQFTRVILKIGRATTQPVQNIKPIINLYENYGYICICILIPEVYTILLSRDLHGFLRQMGHLKVPKTKWLRPISRFWSTFHFLTDWCPTSIVPRNIQNRWQNTLDYCFVWHCAPWPVQSSLIETRIGGFSSYRPLEIHLTPYSRNLCVSQPFPDNALSALTLV